MLTIVLMLLGWSGFVVDTLVFGILLRRNRTPENAQRTSRVVHLLYFGGLVFPGVFAIFYPGLNHLDQVVGIPPLAFKPIPLILGIAALSIGIYLAFASNRALSLLGKGANAFKLTKRVVDSDIYTVTRNPMSLGYYLVCVGVGLVVGSTFVTIGALVAIIPAHLFFLKYFEELELELRFGPAYLEYKLKALPDSQVDCRNTAIERMKKELSHASESAVIVCKY